MAEIFDFLFGWIVDLLYEGVISICMLIITAFKSILTLMIDLANISFFTDSAINELKTRVYLVIGVLMLFKITISCIQYLVNPDKAEDKENGFGGIIKRTIFSVLLLALVPTIFTFAKTAQNAILDALPRIILNQKEKVDHENLGESIAYTTTLAFFGYSSDGCNNKSIQGLPGGNSGSKFKNTNDVLYYVRDIATDQSCGGENTYSFNWLLCLPTGIFLVFVLISMTVDVGVRVIKFGFLELIAPVPIASYIDPKTSKKSFDSWVHNCISVYVDLFIRLGVIYLILYLFEILLPSFQSKFILNDGTALSWGRSMLVNAAIVIALFMFAKNAPKFICDVLGIKDSGSIGDMFKRAGGFAASSLAGLAAGRGGYRSKSQWGAKKGSALAGGLRAAMAGTARGLYSSAKGDKMTDVFKNSRNKARAAADKRYEFKNRGGTVGTRMSEAVDKWSGVETGAERINKEKNFWQKQLDLKSNEKKNAMAKVNNLNGLVDNHLSMNATGEIATSSGRVYTNYNEFEKEYNRINSIPASARTMSEQLRLTDLIADKAEVEAFCSQITANGHVYKSYVEFLNEYNGLQQIPYDQRTEMQNARIAQMATDKDAVEKFMIKNQSFIALTKPSMDEGNYSAIANDVRNIMRSGTKAQTDEFLTLIGGGDINIGKKIVESLEAHNALTREQAISLNDYISGPLESRAQKGISDTSARERTIPKS